MGASAKKNLKVSGLLRFLSRIIPRISCSFTVGWGWQQERLFQKLQKGLFRRKKKNECRESFWLVWKRQD